MARSAVGFLDPRSRLCQRSVVFAQKLGEPSPEQWAVHVPHRRTPVAAIAARLGCLFAAPLLARLCEITGGIHGKVVAEQGGVLPGFSVTKSQTLPHHAWKFEDSQVFSSSLFASSPCPRPGSK
jgi:hypothetical protein